MLRILVFLTLLPLLPALGEDRALIVGVGEFQSPEIPALRGVQRDIENAKKIAKKLGFECDERDVLRDVTISEFRATFYERLVRGRISGRTLIYFSGQGHSGISKLRGEYLGLLFRDSDIVGGSMINALFTDDLSAMVEDLPSRQNFLFVDANFEKDLSSKSVKPPPKTRGFGIIQTKGLFSSRDRVSELVGMILSKSQPSDLQSRGDFTSNLLDLVHSSDASLTLNNIKDYMSQRNLTVQLAGPSPLYGVSLFAAQTANTLKARFDQKLGSHGADLLFRTNKAHFRVGDSLEISCQVPAQGYLNIVSIDAEGKGSVVFPNDWDDKNRVIPGWFRVPNRAADYELEAAEPRGANLLVAVFTLKSLDLRDHLKQFNLEELTDALNDLDIQGKGVKEVLIR